MSGLLSTTNAGSFLGAISAPGLASLFEIPVPPQHSYKWIYVEKRFQQLITNLAITETQRLDGEIKQAGIRSCLNRAYYGHDSETANSLLIGSWGKRTRVRPSRDIDILFLLPEAVYHRFQLRTGNIQSQLLQEVKGVLEKTYSQTTIRGDGQVVVVPFNSMPVEVSPGFLCNDGTIIVCDTNNGGRYITSTALAEAAMLNESDQATTGNARRLARMMKLWQRHCKVPLKSFQLERLVCEFLTGCTYGRSSYFYYDWLVRDFFGYLAMRANTFLMMPGSGELLWLGSDWLSRTQTAHRNAIIACGYEHDNANELAGLYWQDIFGSMIPSAA